jgi:hypothetical protein
MQILMSTSTGCNSIYNALQKKNTNKTKSGQKWEQKLDMICSNSKWKTICTIPFTSTQDTNIRLFQFRIVHRILATNVYLSKIGIKAIHSVLFANNMTKPSAIYSGNANQSDLFGTNLNFGYSKKLDYFHARKCSIRSPYKR